MSLQFWYPMLFRVRLDRRVPCGPGCDDIKPDPIFGQGAEIAHAASRVRCEIASKARLLAHE